MAIREISAEQISDHVRRLCIEANTVLGDDLVEAIRSAYQSEASPVGKEILTQLLENAQIAREERIPLCQDTGMAIVFLEMGQDVHIVGGGLEEAINEGVRKGYEEGYLRASTLNPVSRKNFGDNSPAIIHLSTVPGSGLRLLVAPKGFGAENMSGVSLFPPAVGLEGVKEYVIKRVEEAGSKACPPLVVGIGLGGTLEKAALIAKRSLFRTIGDRHPDPEIAALESELLEKINRLGIGPQGLGGNTTALDVHIETFPTHIGSLPVAVNLQCHCSRHKEVVI